MNLLAVGCRTAETDPLLQGQVVLNAGPGAQAPSRTSAEAQAEGERAVAQAEAAWRAGDPLTAMAIAGHALARGVPPDAEARLREIRARARAAVVAEKIVRIRSIPLRDVVADGDPVPVRLVLRNLSSAELRSPRREGGSSDALFVLQVLRDDHDVHGNVRSSEFTLRAPVGEDLVLPPGGEREVQVSISPDLVRLTHQGFSVYRIGGTFRPVVLRVGDTEFFDALPVEPATVRVLQKGYEQLADDPPSALRKAIAKRSPPHVVAAAELLAPQDRAEAREVLREAAARDPDLAPCLDAARRRLEQLDAPARGAGSARP